MQQGKAQQKKEKKGVEQVKRSRTITKYKE